MADEKTEGQILSPGIDVGGFRVKPWSFEQFFDLLPVFVKGSMILKDKGIGVKEFESLGEDPDKILSIVSSLGPIIPEVVARTIERSIEEVNKMEFDHVVSIALVVLIQNVERIKNFSGLAKTAMSSLVTS